MDYGPQIATMVVAMPMTLSPGDIPDVPVSHHSNCGHTGYPVYTHHDRKMMESTRLSDFVIYYINIGAIGVGIANLFKKYWDTCLSRQCVSSVNLCI